MKISIICPTYNASSYINDLLLNLESQTYRDFELILIDDNSTDDTSLKVEEMKKKITYKILYLKSRVNIGAANARNLGLDNVNGEYVAFLDVDDLWVSTKLEEQLNYMEANGYKFTYTYFYNMYETQKSDYFSIRRICFSPQITTKSRISLYNPIKTSTVMYNYSFHSDIRFSDIRKRQDYGFWIELIDKTKAAFLLAEYLMFYRISEKSLSRTSKFGLIKYHWHLHHKFRNKNVLVTFFLVFSNILMNGFILKFRQKSKLYQINKSTICNGEKLDIELL